MMVWLNVQPATVQDGDIPPAEADGLVVICDWDPPALHRLSLPVRLWRHTPAHLHLHGRGRLADVGRDRLMPYSPTPAIIRRALAAAARHALHDHIWGLGIVGTVTLDGML